MTQGQIGHDAIYALEYTEDELHRLTDQGQLFASSTRALPLEAGIGPGMRVLDVGCGPSDVSSASGATQVRFVQTDLREFPVDTMFDAVVARFVLMYLADPADVVRRVAQYVRPGGVVAFQEFQFDFTTLASAPVPLFEQFRSWGAAVFRRAGGETRILARYSRVAV